MTVKELLALGPDGLEKLTDDDVKKHFEPYLKIIQLEKPKDDTVEVSGNTPVTAQRRSSSQKKDVMEEYLRMCKLAGIQPVELPKELKLKSK